VRAQEKRRQREHQLDEERQAKQRAYTLRLVEIEDEIEHQKRILKDQADERDRQQAIEQKKQDLRNLQAKTKHPRKQPEPASSSSEPLTTASSNASNSQSDSGTYKVPLAHSSGVATNVQPITTNKNEGQPHRDNSEARDDWKWQKKFEGAENEALDSLVSMIGTLSYPRITHILT
jgi:hypothetical protein